MKRKIGLGILILFIGIIGIVISILLQQRYYSEFKSTPDSGNDFSYDSGGSSSGGGGGYDLGGGGKSNPVLATIFILGHIVFFGGLYLWYHNETKKDMAEIEKKKNELIALGYNPDELCKQAFYVYLNVQFAWMNFDYKTLRYFLSDELYNNYVELLEQKRLKGEQNIMDNISLGKKYFIKSYEILDDKLIFTVLLTVNLKDYIVNNYGNLIRGDKYMHEVEYLITYELSKENINICPNCGAKLTNASSEICSYCGSVIINKNHGLIMVKKEISSQH